MSGIDIQGGVQIRIREMTDGDPERLSRLFAGTPWDRGVAFFEDYLSEQRQGSRVVLVGLTDGAVAGYGYLAWQSAYPPFAEAGIPEIKDLNVAPAFRRRRVASHILDEAERLAAQRSKTVGIGVGLHPGYRAAQRLYVMRGYVPDGHGLFRTGRFPEEGERVTLDDELLLHLTKDL